MSIPPISSGTTGKILTLWAKLTNILESHITGDPTLRFQSINEVDANALFKEPYSESRMLELLQSPYADIQNFALHNLYRNDYPGISDLLRKTFETSSFMMVRFTCLALLEKISDKNFREVLHLEGSQASDKNE